MWKGTAETLKAKPTIIKTIPNTAPEFASFKFIEIICYEKFMGQI